MEIRGNFRITRATTQETAISFLGESAKEGRGAEAQKGLSLSLQENNGTSKIMDTLTSQIQRLSQL